MPEKRKNPEKVSKAFSKKFFILISIFCAGLALAIPVYKASNQNQMRFAIEQVQEKEVLDLAVEFLKKKEGFSPTPYHCKAGVRTIGYGDTIHLKQNPKTKSITEEKASRLLREKVTLYRELLKTYRVTVGKKTVDYTQTLTASQQASLISFIYNVGEDAFSKSDLREKIDAKIATELKLDKDYNKNPSYKGRLEKDLNYIDTLVKKEFLKWSKVRKGKEISKLEGLEKRRREEARMFLASNR